MSDRLGTDRPLLTLLGLLAVAGGLATLFAPELAGLVDTNYTFVKLVGLLAAVQGLRVVQERRRSDVDQAETDDPETAVPAPTPGEGFDERLRSVRVGSREERFRSRKQLQNELESAVADAIVQQEGCSPEEAEARLETGEWTDDPYAAAFVGGPNPPRRSWSAWLRQSLGGETRFERRARRTADAVVRYVEGER
ncbi:DUF7269 family protein [Halomicrococcus gelatinilyticus]|uniref:DUF7269 family protein n=1 Tax=Halomicrococcus gelatinilyticus TaxID=1702103 RepID=UPI002E14AFAF